VLGLDSNLSWRRRTTRLRGRHGTGSYQYESDFHKKADAHGKASAVVTFLDARGILLTEEQKQRIRACVDRDVLDRWTRRAATPPSHGPTSSSRSDSAALHVMGFHFARDPLTATRRQLL